MTSVCTCREMYWYTWTSSGYRGDTPEEAIDKEIETLTKEKS